MPPSYERSNFDRAHVGFSPLRSAARLVPRLGILRNGFNAFMSAFHPRNFFRRVRDAYVLDSLKNRYFPSARNVGSHWGSGGRSMMRRKRIKRRRYNRRR